jgi:hypothetical protein
MKFSLSWIWIAVLSLMGSLRIPFLPTNVTITSFTAEASPHSITVRWESASEINNLGFHLWRSLEPDDDYANISGFIPSLDEGIGASYEYEDIDVTSGVTYYYKLQDLPSDGSFSNVAGPISATISMTTTHIFFPAVYRGLLPSPP